MSRYHGFADDLLRMLGLEDRYIQKLTLTLDTDKPPLIEVVEYIFDGSKSETANRKYRLTDVSDLAEADD